MPADPKPLPLTPGERGDLLDTILSNLGTDAYADRLGYNEAVAAVRKLQADAERAAPAPDAEWCVCGHPDDPHTSCNQCVTERARIGYVIAPAPDAERLREAERAADEALAERDALIERLDEIAYAIAPESVIGEHSSANDPWANALAYLDGDYAEFPGIAAAKFALAERAAPAPDAERLDRIVRGLKGRMDYTDAAYGWDMAIGVVLSAIKEDLNA